MSNNAHDLSNRLLNALDNNYNVVDMHTVNEIISILEKINITKELLETTRLGKHVNELRRKTGDPTLARRAKVLVKRWRDLVIPSVASPGHTGSNRSSAERQVRRLGGTPLTSPALSRVVSPAVNSPRPPSRPAWGGYESDSQDVILVDDDPPPTLPPPPPVFTPAPALAPQLKPLTPQLKPLTPPVKRPISPVPLHDEKKAKRDKKPKKRRGHSRAGSGTEATADSRPPAPAPSPALAAPAVAGAGAWGGRNGAATAERRRNGYRRDKVDPYAAMVNRMPPAGAKKVKTTKELLEEIQSRGSRAATSPPASPASPDVMLIEPDTLTVKVDSPLRNGDTRAPSPAPPPPPATPPPPLEDERPYWDCTCGDEPQPGCPAGEARVPTPTHVFALHHALLPGVNGTRAPRDPHKFAVRPSRHPDEPALFASVVPLYNYSDYADDYVAKNMSRVPLCVDIPWTEFAPSPPSPPPPPAPPSPRPYPIDPGPDVKTEPESPPASPEAVKMKLELVKIEAEMVGVPSLEPSERLKAPLLSNEEETQFGKSEKLKRIDVAEEFQSEQRDHRTVERTKTPPVEILDGKALVAQCERARAAIPYDYNQFHAAPVVTLPTDDAEVADKLTSSLAEAEAETERDDLGRPLRHARFAEWHECAKLGELIALPYVVID